MKPTAALILTVAAVLVAMAIGSTTSVQAATCGATYTVQSGDYLSLIASNCNVAYTALLEANPNITNPDNVTIGQVIKMPSAAANNAARTLAAAGSSSATSTSTGTSSATATPTAQATTAAGSATATGSSMATPTASIPNTGSTSAAGSTSATGSTSAAAAGGRTYTIQSGDTLSSIAQSFNISLTDLLNANTDIPDANTIYAGQTINLPSNASATPSSNSSSTGNSGTASSGSVLIPNTGGTGNTYTVQSGDTLSAIAVQNNTTVTNLVNANSAITNPDLIFTGQVINIR